MQTNCQANAKLVVNKRLNMLRLLVTFDIAANSVTVRNAAYASGDLCCAETTPPEVQAQILLKELQRAKAQLRTDNIVLVG